MVYDATRELTSAKASLIPSMIEFDSCRWEPLSGRLEYTQTVWEL
jgi:hypothetical protein